MYELCNLTGNTYYINCPAKIGLYVENDSSAYLIDSGNDKDAGKKVKKILEENNWNLKAIINTHSHADHIGGNKYLQNTYSCKIYAKGIERAFTDSPILEPSFLNGSYPSKNLLHKFLFAQDSECDDIKFAHLPEGFEIIDLPGHSFEMIGVRTPDNVTFIADSISSPSTIEKYGISYIYNVDEYIQTLDKLCTLKSDFFVPTHCEICSDLQDIVTVNKDKVFEITDSICKALITPKSFEQLLAYLFEKYVLTMSNEQYVLIGSTVKSYLSYLIDKDKIESYFENNIMLWKSL